ncbi:MAG: cobalt-precorrin-5B (C(1))-methyltransferase CbiD, partial [Desulfonatronovibrio sp.]
TGRSMGSHINVDLPNGQNVLVPIIQASISKGQAEVLVRKDAGDDPDETHGLSIGARVCFEKDGLKISGGPGVGQVTRPGLAVKPGNPAINPVPLEMIRSSVADITDRGLLVEIFVPDGERIASKTMNQRLGIVGGISILGTSGIVRPFSVEAIQETIALNLNMVDHSESVQVVLVPGRIGFRAAQGMGFHEDVIVEVSNEWDFSLKNCLEHPFKELNILGHPGKLLKFLKGQYQTHSRSGSAVPVFIQGARECLRIDWDSLNTVEQGLTALNQEQRSKLGDYFAHKLKNCIKTRTEGRFRIKVYLINLQGEVFGSTH